MIIGELLYKCRQNAKLKKRYKVLSANRITVESTGYIDELSKLEGNNTIAGKIYQSTLGFGTYVHENSVLKCVRVGRFCSIGEDVNIRLFEHPVNMVSTSPSFYRKSHNTFKSYVSQNYSEDLNINADGYSVEIGNDVWIGRGASIKSGITIADGAVIAAGAVVTHDVGPYEIVGGVPAKLIRKRFDDETIEKLLAIRWWEHDEKWLCEHGDEFSDVSSFVQKHEIN